MEGSAVYTDFQHRYSQGQASYEERYRFLWSSLGRELNAEIESSLSFAQLYEFSPKVGYLAMEWLVAEAGEAAVIDFFVATRTAESWETAFRQAFGLSVDDFYRRFEEHRLEVAPPFKWDIQGVVNDRIGQPVEGLRIFPAVILDGQPFSTLSEVTASDGSFSISGGPGSRYVLLVRGKCESGASEFIGAEGQDGFTANWRSAPVFTGRNQDRTGLVIRLPFTMEEFERKSC